MVLSISFPAEYGYVLAPAVATGFVNSIHQRVTGKLRKAAKVPYPNSQATAVEASSSTEKYLFNCAYRAHTNFVENLPTFLVSLLVSGLQFPVTSAAIGTAWLVGRVLFLYGYTRKTNNENGQGRYLGMWWFLPHYALVLMATHSTFKIITG